MTLTNIDRFFGETASIEELAVLWPPRNTTGRGNEPVRSEIRFFLSRCRLI